MSEQHTTHEEPLFYDALFRQKRKHGKYRVVEPVHLETAIADTHVHLQLLPSPALALARAGFHNVNFLCTIVDAYEDGLKTFEQEGIWRQRAAELLAKLVAQQQALESQADVPQDTLQNAPGDIADQKHTVVLEGVSSLGGICPCIPSVRIATGCHPHNARHYDDTLEKNLRNRLADGRVCAVGEIGLDFHYDYSPRSDQIQAFRRQLRLAHEMELPVVLHIREAHDVAFALLQEEGFPQAGTLLHCFNRSWEVLQPWVGAGCFVAFGGALTFKQSTEVRDAAARTPLAQLLLETDGPFMAPEPLRGMICGPDHLIFTAERMAQVRGALPGDARKNLLLQIGANTHQLLDRAPTSQQCVRCSGLCDTQDCST